MAPQTFALVTLPLLSRRRLWWAAAPQRAAAAAPLEISAGYVGGQAGRPAAGLTRFEPTLPPSLLAAARAVAPTTLAAFGAAALALFKLGGGAMGGALAAPALAHPLAPRLCPAGWASLTAPGAWYGPEGRPHCRPLGAPAGAFGPLHRVPTQARAQRVAEAPRVGGDAVRTYQAAWVGLREAPVYGAPGAHATLGGAVATPRRAPATARPARAPSGAPGPALGPSWAAEMPAVGPLARRHQWRV